MNQLVTAVRCHGTIRRIAYPVLLTCFLVVLLGSILSEPHQLNILNRSAGTLGPSAKRLVSKKSAPPLPNSAIAAMLKQDVESPQHDGESPQEVPPKIDPCRAAMLLNLSLLEEGYNRLKKIKDYTATFFKQERIGGKLGEEDVTEIKIRHSPFSVYMKWLVNEAGKELLYVQGKNDGNLLVRQVGWKARLLPELTLDPCGPIAMSESRHPVTDAGLLMLVKTLIADRRRDMQENSAVNCQVYEEEYCFDRACYRFVIEYDDPTVSTIYRKSEQYIDKDLLLPIEIANYTWPVHDQENWSGEKLDEATLIEFYGYDDIQLDAELVDLDFDRTNAEYGFDH